MFTVNASIVFVSAIVREVSAVLTALRSALLAHAVRPMTGYATRWLDNVLTRTNVVVAASIRPIRPFAPMSVVLSAADLAPIAPTHVPADAMLTIDRVQPHDSAAHVVAPIPTPTPWERVNVGTTAPATIPMPTIDAAPTTEELASEDAAIKAELAALAQMGAQLADYRPVPTDGTISARKAARKSRAPRKAGRKPSKVAAQATATESPAFVQPARLYSDADLAGMNRKALQAAVKTHRAALPPEVKGNSASDAIRTALALLTA